MDLSVGSLQKILVAFRKSKWFRAFYVAVLGLVVASLYYYVGLGGQVVACLGFLLIPVSVFVIPYWLGERSLKAFALNALPVFVIALFVISAFQTQAVLGQGAPSLSSGVDPATPAANLPPLSLWNGTVDPYRGSGVQTYAFHVRLKTGTGVDPANVTVYLNLTRYGSFSSHMSSVPMAPETNPTGNGTVYAAQQTLEPALYVLWFFAHDTRGNVSFTSPPVIQPINDSPFSYYGFWLSYLALDILVVGLFYFMVLFMYWYTVRTRKMRARLAERLKKDKLDLKKGPPEEEAKEEGAKDETDSAPKSKKAAAFTCTNCGADVTEDDAKCPKCGAVFED